MRAATTITTQTITTQMHTINDAPTALQAVCDTLADGPTRGRCSR